MDAVVVVPEVAAAVLPPSDRACALACANLWLAAAGLRLGEAGGIFMGALPLLAIGVIEKLAFNTSHFAAMLENRLSGGGEEAFTMPGSFPMDPMTHLTPERFLSSPGLWIGLAIAAALLAAAVRLRRQQGPI